jgi:hypothetical protein
MHPRDGICPKCHINPLTSTSGWCRECLRKYQLKWREKNRKKFNEYHRKYNSFHKAEISSYDKLSNQKDRETTLIHYGGNPPKCSCCGETKIEFLVIDHINGGGSKHRKAIGNHIHRWLRLNNYPDGYQVLCHNCNMAKGLYGYCPHQHEH